MGNETPTNDAPVTAEQCDRDFTADILDFIAGLNTFPDAMRHSASCMRQGAKGEAQFRPLTDMLARHRLAALASAPAGDGADEEAARAYFERGFMACYAWQYVNKAAQLSDAVIDHAWDNREEGGELPSLASAPAGDGLEEDKIVSRAVEQVMRGFSFETLAGPENLRARLSLCARQAVHDTAAALVRPRAAVGEDFLTQLRRVNTDRYQAWVGDGQDAGILFDAAELGGEVGELLNVVKKLEREGRGWRGSRAAPEDFADECADVLICLDKLARRKGVDLAAATVAKFNATSAKVDLPHRLALQSPPAKVEG